METKLDVIANNLANMNTTAYKGEKMMFVEHLVKSKGGKISMVASKQYHDMTCAEIENFVRDYWEFKMSKLSDEEVNDKYNSYFELIGVCNHSGGAGFGHYYSYCKYTDGNWYEFNDSSVSKISKEKIVSSSAYCLFYKKKK